jgi:hypothetical protein
VKTLGFSALLVAGLAPLPALAQVENDRSRADTEANSAGQQPTTADPAVPSKAVTAKAKRPDPNALPPVTGRGPRLMGYYSIRSNDVYPADDDRILPGLKNIPIGPDGETTLTFSGDGRMRNVYQTYGSFAGAGKKDQWFTLLRAQLAADLQIGDHIRAFGQVVAATQQGVNFARPAAARQEDPLDIAQGFVEFRNPIGSGSYGVRIGRQQMHFGAGQILGLQQAANVLKNYDAVTGYYYSPKLRVDVFAMRPVAQAIGVFDDRSNEDVFMTGAYVSTPMLRRQGVSLNFDSFYLRFDNDAAAINQQSGRERRNSFGGRVWGRLGRARMDATVIYQNGEFRDRPISAATVQTSLTAPLSTAENPIEATLQFDLATGGSRNANRVGTYNPIYPANEYVSLNAFIFLSNIYDLSPSITVPISDKASVEFIQRWYWRYSTDDAVYGQNFVALAPSLRSKSSFTGIYPSVDLRWEVNRNFETRLSAGYFRAADAMRAVGLRNSGTARLDFTFAF